MQYTLRVNNVKGLKIAYTILYYSQTGNTEKMARAVAEGAKSVPGVSVELVYYAKAEDLADADAIILGMPTYYHDVGIDMKHLLEEVAAKRIKLKGKIGTAFGSYGWSGEAPTLLLEIMKKRFEMETIEPGLTVRYAPNEKALEECRKLGKTVAERIVKSRLNKP
jgi:flavorubredoxin